MPTGLVLLDNPIKPYAWGSRTAIPRMLGLPTPSPEPAAEMWIGAHPAGPSRIAGGQRLDELIASAPAAILGERVSARFDGRLPLLVKLLAAAEPLSIQAHPSRAQAEAGFAREEADGIARDAPHRSYRDANHKPELIIALERFRALCGFRPRDEIAALFQKLAAPSLAGPVAAFAAGGELRALYAAVMQGVPDAQEAAARAGAGDPAFAEVAALAARYPGDPGILSPLFLNVVTLERDEALFLGAGELHAYLEGFGVEVMASSDNVLRGGLTPKHVDVKELLATLTFETGRPEVLRPSAASARGERVYATPAPEFRVSVIDLDGSHSFDAAPSGAEILLATAGRHTVTSERWQSVELPPGGAALVTAEVGRYAITGRGRVFRAAIPDPGDE